MKRTTYNFDPGGGGGGAYVQEVNLGPGMYKLLRPARSPRSAGKTQTPTQHHPHHNISTTTHVSNVMEIHGPQNRNLDQKGRQLGLQMGM